MAEKKWKPPLAWFEKLILGTVTLAMFVAAWMVLEGEFDATHLPRLLVAAVCGLSVVVGSGFFMLVEVIEKNRAKDK